MGVWGAGLGSCHHSCRVGYPCRGQETGKSHPEIQGHTGRSLVPEIASGRCLRWHRALGILHTEALEKRLEDEMEPRVQGSPDGLPFLHQVLLTGH